MRLDAVIHEYINKYFSGFNNTVNAVDNANDGSGGVVQRKDGDAYEQAGMPGVKPAVEHLIPLEDARAEAHSFLEQLPPDMRAAAEALMAYQAPITAESLEKLLFFIQTAKGMDVAAAALLATDDVSIAPEDMDAISDILYGRYNIAGEINALAGLYSKAAESDSLGVLRGLISARGVCEAVIQHITDENDVAGHEDADAVINASGTDGDGKDAADAGFVKPGISDSDRETAGAHILTYLLTYPGRQPYISPQTSPGLNYTEKPGEPLYNLLDELLDRSMISMAGPDGVIYSEADGAQTGGGYAGLISAENGGGGTRLTESASNNSVSPDIVPGAGKSGNAMADVVSNENPASRQMDFFENSISADEARSGDAVHRTGDIYAKLSEAVCDFSRRYYSQILSHIGESASAGISSAAREGYIRDLLTAHIQRTPEMLFNGTDSTAYTIKQQYGQMLIQLAVLRASLKSRALQSPEKPEILRRIESLEDGIRLINNINNRHQYMQIPVNFGAETSNLELFVMKRGGKKRRIDPEDMTLFLSLDTNHIGRIEALVHIVKKVNVSVNLRAENAFALSLLRDGQQLLYNALDEKGYKLTGAAFRIIEERTNAANAAGRINKLFPNERGRVDYRI